jgi:hypothetical protein
MGNFRVLDDELKQKFNSEIFLKNTSPGGDVPVYLYTYEAALELDFLTEIKMLVEELKISGKNVLVIDLFWEAMNLVKEKGYLDMLLEAEAELSKEEFLSQFCTLLDMKKNFLPYLKKLFENYMQTKEPDLVFFIGGSHLFPVFRIHQILNKMENLEWEVPIVFFYPGRRDESTLLFLGLEKLRGKNYYRAIPLN